MGGHLVHDGLAGGLSVEQFIDARPPVHVHMGKYRALELELFLIEL